MCTAEGLKDNSKLRSDEKPAAKSNCNSTELPYPLNHLKPTIFLKIKLSNGPVSRTLLQWPVVTTERFLSPLRSGMCQAARRALGSGRRFPCALIQQLCFSWSWRGAGHHHGRVKANITPVSSPEISAAGSFPTAYPPTPSKHVSFPSLARNSTGCIQLSCISDSLKELIYKPKNYLQSF